MAFEAHIETILSRHRELAALMADPARAGDFAKLSKEYADLQPVVDAAAAYRAAMKERADLDALLDDPEMKAAAQEELIVLKDRIPALEEALHLALLPRDAADERSAILEIRAGTGGQEAALFAGDLLRMYKAYAAIHNWRFEIMDASESDLGGVKDVVVSVEGAGVFARLKYESGVHRVQRVPETEASGRVHTSAATVAVLPEAEEADIHINENDLRIDTYRASGAGGQHVNRTDSAIRITHIPTGTVVAMQEERSQHKNRAKAMKILKSRILDAERQKLAADRAADRKSQVGSGDRSERIRTYNFPQGRVTDHRVNLTLYAIDRVMNGQDLDTIVDALTREDQAEKMASLQNGA
ncbi:MAG: peptide chain release factor 1 [Rhodospirillales bacterium]|nr:peptide chain release factor 1 [Rhodospirillales bacterium]USO07506.1 MAG: peptide chain release factor 1 [Rhodospirillales bacterium]